MTFKTLRFPSVTFLQPTDYKPDSVTLNANVNPNRRGATTFHYKYGLTNAYGSSTPESESIRSDSNDHLASATISRLAPGTTYHYRIVATAAGGDTRANPIRFSPLFRGTNDRRQHVTERSPTSARVSADFKPGFRTTLVYFQYGPTSEYSSATVPGPALAADDEAHPVYSNLQELTPDTVYHYKVIAVNFNGASTSSYMTFTTGRTPRISSESATAIT